MRTAFQQLLDRYPVKNRDILVLHEETILNQAKANCRLSNEADILKELNRIVHLNTDGFRCFVGDDGTEAFELDSKANDSEPMEDNPNHSARITARNFLRYLTRGTPIQGVITPYAKSLAAIEKLIKEKNDPTLLRAACIEMEKVFHNIFLYTLSIEQFPDKEHQLNIFIKNLLCLYPFLNPNPDQSIYLPQKINNQWEWIQYRVKKLDISPKKGLLAYLLQDEDEDHIYAYGLTPADEYKGQDVKSQLLMMGTTYSTGQGAKLSMLYNFRPTYSVGEGHDLSAVSTWIQEQKYPVHITGHSQGGTLAMIIAAHHPNEVKRADCLNPTGLRQATLDRLKSKWPKNKKDRPAIYCYTQEGDPIFELELDFLEGTTIFKILSHTQEVSNYKWYIPRWVQRAIEAHAHYFMGREGVLMLNVNPNSVRRTSLRKFLTHGKWFVNIVVFYSLYSHFVAILCAKKIDRFYQRHKKLANVMGIGLLVFLGLASVALFLPLPILALFITKLGFSAVSSGTLPYIGMTIGAGLGFVSAFVLKPVLYYTGLLTEGILFVALPVLLTVISALVGSVLSAIKVEFERLCACCIPDKEEEPYEPLPGPSCQTHEHLATQFPLVTDHGNLGSHLHLESCQQVSSHLGSDDQEDKKVKGLSKTPSVRPLSVQLLC